MPSLTNNVSLLSQDIADILEPYKVQYNGTFTIEAKLHTTQSNLDSSDTLILNSISIIRDYVNNISDYIEVQLSVHLGTYLYDIYPYLDNIEVTLITHKQLYQGKKPYVVKERYKAIFLLDKNSKLPTTINQSKEDLNQQLPIVITLQLLDRAAETLRVKTTQGSFDKVINPKNKDMKIKSFLKSVISEEIDKVLIENKQAIDTISIEEPDNKDELKAITIPSYTRIVELPEYIQNKNIGMYNAGIGNYIQKFATDPFTYKKSFFIYSLYDSGKYDQAEYKILFYVPVSTTESLSELTYKYKDKILRILPHHVSKIQDEKETGVMSRGSGFRLSNANTYMKKPVEMQSDGPVFKQTGLNTEIVFKDRADNLNFAPNKFVTGNPFKYASDVLESNGNYITLQVSNMDHDFIYPGASCKIMYENKEHKVAELFGVIHKAYIVYNSTSMNMPLSYNSRTVALTSQITLQIFITDK